MTDLKEQFLERLLRELFHRKGEGFVLKGGGAMRALFGEHRLTKDVDLDFTNPKRTADSLHNTVVRAIERAARTTRVTDLRLASPGKAERTPRWKVNFSDASGRTHHVEVEVSRDRERAVPGRVRQVRFVPAAMVGTAPFFVDIYDGSALIASKLAALLGREVPRDVYDLDALIDVSDPPDADLIAWAIERAGVHDRAPVDAVKEHLEAMKWSRFQDELLDSLPPSAVARVDADEWNSMKQRVLEYATRLLS